MTSVDFLPEGRDNILYRELDDGCIVYDAESNQGHILNITAAYIWNCCDGHHSIESIARDLQGLFSLNFEEALKHVESTIAQFQESRLLSNLTARPSNRT
ncbi:MAG: PqqD family protein [Candidatus Poribacteria bacterium]|nr:PqqD family protein [Candidatus Poribacteria bacterium]